MGDIEPGWYDDTEDPRLARWWDGRAWTEHTLVIADQPPGANPPPPPARGTRFPVPPASEWLDDPSYAEAPPEEPTRIGSWAWPPLPQAEVDPGWHRLDDDEAEYEDELVGWAERRRVVTDEETLGERIRRLPLWVRVALPVLAVVLLVAAVASAGGSGGDDDGGTSTTEDTSSDDAERLAAAADAGLEAADVSWFTRQGFLASIPPMCDAIADGDADRVADRVILLGYDAFTAARLVIGLEAAAQSYCPEDLAEHAGFFEEVARQADVDLASGVTTSTSPTVPSTTSTTKATTTTRRSAPPPTAATTTTTAATTTTTIATTTSTEATTTTTVSLSTGGATDGTAF